MFRQPRNAVQTPQDDPWLPPINLWLVMLEISLILALVWTMTGNLRNPSQQMTLQGLDFFYVSGSGAVAAQVFQKTGAIPLWNPFIGNGEPLIESLFSYVLNPLMSLPILIWGVVQGAKVAVTLHIVLMSLGGWSLGRVLGLRAAGRTFLGLLLAGSGGFAGMTGWGFYQLGLSLVYIPWIATGLFATLYSRRRWPIALLAVSAALFTFAGTFWYVLPTVLAAGVIVLFHVAKVDFASRQVQIDKPVFRRVGLALVFALGLAAIRLLPQLNSYLVGHQVEDMTQTRDFALVALRYFYVGDNDWARFHFVLPVLFAFLLLVLRAVLAYSTHIDKMLTIKLPSRWRVMVPAALSILIFTIWAQGDTPIVKWLYTHVAFLNNWRTVERVGAAAEIWVAVIAAIWLDDLLRAAWKLVLQQAELRGSLQRVGRAIGATIMVILLAGGLIASVDVLTNWQRAAGLASINQSLDEDTGLQFLRQRYPTKFLPVQTAGILYSFDFYNQLTRSSNGNADVFVHGLKPTLGNDDSLSSIPEYSVGNNINLRKTLNKEGYEPIPGSPLVDDLPVAWQNPNALPYVFTAPLGKFGPYSAPLTRQETTEVTEYDHEIDQIRLTVGGYAPSSVLVVWETAYPGWTVSVDGQPADIESISGRITVILPDKPTGTHTEVVFVYRPPLVYIGGVVTVLNALALTVFMLGLERRVRKPAPPVPEISPHPAPNDSPR